MAATRTTLTLDPDVARLLDDEVHRSRKTFKDVVNDALRRGLGGNKDVRRPKRYRVVAHDCTLAPGIDISSFNRLLDEWDADEGLRRAVGSK